MNGLFVWTEPRVDHLRALFAQGLSYGQIAADMAVRFEVPVSRCAIGGKLLRIGLQRGRGGVRAGSGRPAKSPRVRRRAPFRAPPLDGRPPPIAPAATAAPPDARHRCGLLELTNESCRFVVSGDGPPFEFCGAPEADFPDVPYCPHHARIVYRRPGEREEAA